MLNESDDNLPHEISDFIKKVCSEHSFSVQVESQDIFSDSHFREMTYVPFDYLNIWHEYDRAKSAALGLNVFNFSILFIESGSLKACWRLKLSSGPTMRFIGTLDVLICAPIFVTDCNPKFVKRVNKLCILITEQVNERYCAGKLKFVDHGPDSIGISNWHDLLRHRDVDVQVLYDFYIDLTVESDKIWNTIRSSYKSLINKGQRLWTSTILQSVDESQWNEFRSLHRTVSGRDTRSIETWNIQLRMIQECCAFAVLLRDDSGALIGGGFFAHSRDEGLYFSGAYDRSLFPLPLGHVVQWKAISEFKRRGVRWYRLGTAAMGVNGGFPSVKELSITNFKEGFATHTFPRYVFQVSKTTPEKAIDG